MRLDEAFSSVSSILGFGPVCAAFYPYAELKHTWRFRDGTMEFRISDYMDQCSDAELLSLAWYLLSKARGIECPAERSEAYLRASRSRALWSGKKEAYISRADSLALAPQGTARDLKEVFRYVNSRYFMSRFSEPLLAWSSESPRRRLGFYFEPLNLLAVNRIFDSAKVPRYALEFVVYHELLHSDCSPEGSENRRMHHTKRFRERERQFSHYQEAQPWMARLARGGKRVR